MTDASAVSIASQMILVGNRRLVLPNTAVAEIVTVAAYDPHTGEPDWLLGMIPWRGLSVPLLSYETLCGGNRPALGAGSPVAVLNALGANPELRFFAIVTSGIPQLVQLDASRISVASAGSEPDPLVLSHVLVDGEPAIIPDLDALEGMLLAAMGQTAS